MSEIMRRWFYALLITGSVLITPIVGIWGPFANGSGASPGAREFFLPAGFAVTSTLQEVEPKRRIAWTGNAFGSKAKHVWVFKPQGDGTRVTTEESMEGWLIVLLKPLMPKFLEQSLDVWVSSLKTKAEGTANSK